MHNFNRKWSFTQFPHPLRGGAGPVQLLEFLLQLLTDPAYNELIAWTAGSSHSWEFRLVDTEAVAKLWGARKKKPRMNYEKLSRGTFYISYYSQLVKYCTAY